MTTGGEPDPTVPRPHGSPFRDFPARAYLDKYYGEVGSENQAFLRAIYGYVERVDPTTDEVIEVAGGPSLFSMMAMAAHRRRPFGRVVFTDLGRENLEEVRRWLDDRRDQFDHGELLEWLGQETGAPPEQVAAALRESPWELVPVDWSQDPPEEWAGAFDVVSSHFFAESATSDEDEFIELMGRLPRLGRPGAVVLMSFISGSESYTVEGRPFPAFPVDEHSISSYLERAELQLEDIAVSTVAAQQPEASPGYHGLLFVGGRLPAAGRGGLGLPADGALSVAHE